MAIPSFFGELIIEGGKLGAATIATLAAAFAGAIMAYRLNRQRDNQRERERQESELQMAFYVLTRKARVLAHIRSFLDPVRGNRYRRYALQAHAPLEGAPRATQDLNRLGFMMSRSNLRDVFVLLAAVEDCYLELLAAHERRNAIFVGEYQPILQENGLDTEEPFALDTVDALLSPGFREQLHLHTEALFSLEEELHLVFELTQKKFREATAAEYSGLNFSIPFGLTQHMAYRSVEAASAAPHATEFSICRDVKPSGPGAFDLIGKFPGNDIVIPDILRPDGMLKKVVFYIELEKLKPGSHSIVVQVVAPSGAILVGERGSVDVVLSRPEGRNMQSLVFSFDSFPVPEGGTYSLSMRLDKWFYKWQFQILFQPPFQSPG